MKIYRVFEYNDFSELFTMEDAVRAFLLEVKEKSGLEGVTVGTYDSTIVYENGALVLQEIADADFWLLRSKND